MALSGHSFVLAAPSVHSAAAPAPQQLRGSFGLQERVADTSSVTTLAAGVAVGAFAATATAASRRKQRLQRVAAKVVKGPVDIEDKRFPILSKRAPLGSYPKLPDSVHPGVVTGKCLKSLLNWAKENKIAIPAVNCISSSSINACLEAARANGAPIMIQFSAGGAQFYAGKGLDNTNFHAAIAGAVSGAYHTRALAEQYGIPVILHTDHCAKNLLPWLDGLMDANERYFEQHGEPLFSSHMIDLSEEPLEENIETCTQYLTRMAKINVGLEMELGITGGEEDGVNNEDVNQEDLYSKPEEIWQVYEALSKVPNGFFTVAAAFGNVHGVYSPGNVSLQPKILDAAQKYIAEKLDGKEGEKPVCFVFHGGSGSDLNDIREAIDYGVIKMNIDTDTQWSYWNGIKGFEAKYKPYLQTQIGNPDGEDKPNKKYYDPRGVLRAAEESSKDRLGQCFEDLNSKDCLGLGPAGQPENVLGPRRGGLPA